MKILHIIIGLSTINIASGQSANQKDLVEILNVALRDNKLPDESVIDMPTHLAHAIATQNHRDTKAMARAKPAAVTKNTFS